MNKRKLLLLFLLHICYAAVAQKEKTSLQQILTLVESRFNITFTYIDENIKGLFLEAPSPQLSLGETLEYLQLNTGLTFEQINTRFVAIRKLPVKLFDICGTLVDSETEEKIAGASVQHARVFTVTDESGFFKLGGLTKNSPVIIHSLGYKSVSISLDTFLALPCHTLKLEPQSTTLEEIVISDYITQGISKKVDGSFQINSINLGILPGLIEPDVLQSLQVLPGINSVDETISNITVRGGTNDQNLVLWDGIKMYQTGHFFGLISAFDPFLTQQITLIKNGTSAYLTDGVSSTIDISSIDTLAKEFSGGTGINMINGDFYFRIPLSSKISVQFSSRRSIADMVQTPTYDQYFKRIFNNTDVTGYQVIGSDTLSTQNENFKFYDLNFKVLYDITRKDKLRLSFLHLKNSISYNEELRGDSQVDSQTSSLTQQSTAVGFSYQRLWNDRVKTTIEGYRSQYQLDATNFDIINEQRLIQQNEVLDQSLKGGILLRLNHTTDLVGGYQFSEVGVSNSDDINNPPFSRLVKLVLRTHAAFVETNFTSRSEATTIRTGVRVNYLPKFDKIILEPRLTFNQKLGDHLLFEILGEMKSQTTTQIIDFQSDFLGVEKRRWVLSDNSDFPVLRSRQLSTGLHYSKDEFVIGFDIYYKFVEGINSLSQGFQNQFQYVQSVGNYSARGLDFLINKKFNNINTWLSYSYADNVFEFNSLSPPTFPNNLDIRHNLAVAASYSDGHIQLALGLKWHSGKPYTQPGETAPVIGESINYESPNSSRLEDYLRLDVSVKYNFQLSRAIKAHIGASIWNLLDRNNIIDQYYKINSNGDAQLFQQAALGLTPNVMFRIEF